MRITCPACAAVYQVPDHLLDGQRKLRCKRCQESWMPPPADRDFAPDSIVIADPKPLPPAPVPLLILPEEARLPQPVPRSYALPAAWAASAAVLAAGCAALLIEHRPLAAAWPPLQWLYTLFGWHA